MNEKQELESFALFKDLKRIVPNHKDRINAFSAMIEMELALEFSKLDRLVFVMQLVRLCDKYTTEKERQEILKLLKE